MKNIGIYIKVVCILMCFTVILGGGLTLASEFGTQAVQVQTAAPVAVSVAAAHGRQMEEADGISQSSDGMDKKGRRTPETPVQDIKEKMIYIGNKSQPAIALTFDDGPSDEPTNRILDVLEQYQVRATFFVMGYKAERYAEQLKREKTLRCEIGNHSYDHPQLTTISDSSVKKQISRTSKLIKKITGEKTHLVRPPYGACNENVLSLIKAPAILWSIDTRDWKTRNAEKTISNVLENVQDGDIILMHDVYDATAEAVEELVPELIAQGYQLVTVPELALLKGTTLKKGKSYNRLTAK